MNPFIVGKMYVLANTTYSKTWAFYKNSYSPNGPDYFVNIGESVVLLSVELFRVDSECKITVLASDGCVYTTSVHEDEFDCWKLATE